MCNVMLFKKSQIYITNYSFCMYLALVSLHPPNISYLCLHNSLYPLFKDLAIYEEFIKLLVHFQIMAVAKI